MGDGLEAASTPVASLYIASLYREGKKRKNLVKEHCLHLILVGNST